MGLFQRIDRYIDQLEGEPAPAVSQEEGVRMAYSRIAAHLQDTPQRILLSGDVPPRRLKGLESNLSALAAQTGKSDSFIWAGPLYGSCDAMEKAITCQGVVLVAERGQTTFAQIERQIYLLRQLEKDIWGFILIDQ